VRHKMGQQRFVTLAGEEIRQSCAISGLKVIGGALSNRLTKVRYPNRRRNCAKLHNFRTESDGQHGVCHSEKAIQAKMLDHEV